MPTYLWENKALEEIAEIFRPVAEMDTPPDDREGWVRLLVAPRVLRQSFLDGQRAKSIGRDGQNYRDLKEAAKLKVQAAETDSKSEKKEINAAVKRLEKIK